MNRSFFATLLALGMSPAAATGVWLPAEGIWQIDGANGSGLTLDVRDEAIGIGLYTYDEDGNAVWYAGAGSIEDGRLTAELTSFIDHGEGSGMPPTPVDTMAFALTFDASASGRLSLDGGEGMNVHQAPFGLPYIATLDGVALAAPVPDMRGRWVFVADADDPHGAMQVEFNRMWMDATAVNFATTAALSQATLRCTPGAAPGDAPLDCGLHFIDLGLIAPPPQPIQVFRADDLAASRAAADAHGWIGFRVPEVADMPQSGIWQIAGRFGSGVTIDVRPDLVAVGVYGAADDGGRSRWSLATGPLVDGVVQGDLVTFDGGTCIGCDAGEPRVATTRAMRLEFVGTTRARLHIGDDEPLVLSLLPFGAGYTAPLEGDALAEEFGPHPLPALHGHWVRSGVGGAEGASFSPTRAAAFEFHEVSVTFVGDSLQLLSATSLPHWGPPSEIGGTLRTQLVCTGAPAPDTSHCDLFHRDDGGSPPGPAVHIADLDPADIGANRMSGTVDGGEEAIHLFRIPRQPIAPAR